MENFDANLARFLSENQEAINAHYARNLSRLTPPTLRTEPGKRYIRIVKDDGVSRHVFCFVEIGTGNVLKAASWKAPAKHARGNIADPAGASCSLYGAKYLR